MKVWFWSIVLLKIFHSEGMAQESTLVTASDPVQTFFENANLVGHLSHFFTVNELSSRNALMQVNRQSKKSVVSQDGPYFVAKAKEAHFKSLSLYNNLAKVYNTEKFVNILERRQAEKQSCLLKDLQPKTLLTDLVKLLSSWDKDFAAYYDFVNFDKSRPVIYNFLYSTIYSHYSYRTKLFPSKASVEIKENKIFIQKSQYIYNKYFQFQKQTNDFFIIFYKNLLEFLQSKNDLNYYLGDRNNHYLKEGQSLKMNPHFFEKLEEFNQKAVLIQKDFQQSTDIYNAQKKVFNIDQYSSKIFNDLVNFSKIMESFISAVGQEFKQANVQNVLEDFSEYFDQRTYLDQCLSKRNYDLKRNYSKICSDVQTKFSSVYCKVKNYKKELSQLKSYHQDASGILDQALTDTNKNETKLENLYFFLHKKVLNLPNIPTIENCINAEEILPKIEEVRQTLSNTDQTDLNPDLFIPIEVLKQQLEEAAIVSSANIETENKQKTQKRYFDQI